ncbi:4-(cytidine 5'-diphospho)-2-C-methyl-D-erythritol kinase [Rhizobium paknamense]|uniref:4-diphosphocytidyl-2-C-methyl-D-erythritol kinase n=1 Tax=Rhizobium paknamense TaxID=1206817 RepID=A0ABU0ICM1_9HYPH|nr:4-(cytidine 5'-diphospho)-2-C-methyl-D-erythritol kinase [Rhizobium paknamense]MDQ0455016.1 4-diphosphocytidyl-2-C-methyl-D-erythritol kinase [Rhizobium paknamense]
MKRLEEKAPAKVNLALHVTGRQDDGYHLLDSLVGFSSKGDRLIFEPAAVDGFTISGRFAPLLLEESGGENLVLRARDALRRMSEALGHAAPPVAIHLEKNLPLASGIGGGSADAAATLHGLQRLWQSSLSPERLMEIGLTLGADVPMCLAGKPLQAQGIGEHITPVADFPSFGLVLGNPLKPVSTPAIFKRLESRHNPPIGHLPRLGADQRTWIAFLQTLRNDLEPAARLLCPEIADLAALMAGTGALITRMSGSGATCFSLYATEDEAEKACAALLSARPDWYFSASTLMGSGD